VRYTACTSTWEAEPVYKPFFVAITLLAASVAFAQAPTQSTVSSVTKAGTTEIGQTGGAAYRIDIPANWNHRLVVYYHGYSEKPVTYHGTARNSFEEVFLSRGFAIIQSGYSVTGFALERAMPETELLREHFVAKYGQPTETYVTGHSMGGALTMETIEQAPYIYKGALALCGLLGPSDLHEQQSFAAVAAFNYYFPGLLPPLDPVPSSFVISDAFQQKLERAVDANPTGAAAMRILAGVHSNKDVAQMTMFHLFVVQDLQHKAGGSPFDNRNYLYSGTANDRALNDGVKRYAPDKLAAQYSTRYYTPTGRLMRPMLAVHTTYDQFINPNSIFVYTEEVNRAGFSQNFVQQYVHADGHCNITSPQVGVAFDELLHWTHDGKRPVPGLLP
jgi:pimeloyl-ACP methyl ester carboxylesterase